MATTAETTTKPPGDFEEGGTFSQTFPDYDPNAPREPKPEAKPSLIRRLSDIEIIPTPPLLIGRLHPTKATVLFGPGDIGKGSVASSWISNLVEIGHTVLILDYEDNEEEWAGRIQGLGGIEAREGVIHVPPSRAWGPGAIWDHVNEIIALCKAENITYLVIDSAGTACGGADALKAESAGTYMTALQHIALPSLSLAHVTKAHDARYPFGSVFWHNLCRFSWSMMPKGTDRLLVARKHNNYGSQQAQTVDLVYRDNVLREVTERPASHTLEDRIAEAIEDGIGRTPTEIASLMNDGLPKEEKTAAKTIAATLSRSLKKNGTRSRFTTAGEGKYALRDGPDDNRPTTVAAPAAAASNGPATTVQPTRSWTEDNG